MAARTHRSVGSAAGVLLLVGAALTGCAQAPTAEIGDCLDTTALGGLQEIPTVPCDDPHDAQVFHTFDLPGGDYPGDEEVIEAADAGCVAAFEAYIGEAADESALDIWYLTPPEQGWVSAGDREVICLAVADEPATGSFAGTGR